MCISVLIGVYECVERECVGVCVHVTECVVYEWKVCVLVCMSVCWCVCWCVRQSVGVCHSGIESSRQSSGPVALSKCQTHLNLPKLSGPPAAGLWDPP